MPASQIPLSDDGAATARLSGLRRWSATVAATAVSTYALDLLATAAGLGLVASQALEGVDRAGVLAFLAASYVVWGAALRAALRANWALLEQTGASTSVFSKAAHCLVGARSGSRRARAVAAAAGYIGTELAKETPYYVGAFGAVLATDTVSATEALIFLGGANLGAAGYEFGLARLVRGFLGRRRSEGHASFETDWDPQRYLAAYYGEVQADERHTIAFFVEAFRDVPHGGSVLVFGVGPALHHVFLAAERAGEIHLGDLLPGNLREIERWIRSEPGAHDWRPFVRFTLECEGNLATKAAITRRERLTRAKVTQLLQVDLRRAAPLAGSGAAAGYDTVITAYCADSATGDRATWETYMRRLAGLVRPGGAFLTAALRRSRGYVVGPVTFPSANVGATDLRAALEACFGAVRVEARAAPEQARHGYSGILLGLARRPRRVAPPVRPVATARVLRG